NSFECRGCRIKVAANARNEHVGPERMERIEIHLKNFRTRPDRSAIFMKAEWRNQRSEQIKEDGSNSHGASYQMRLSDPHLIGADDDLAAKNFFQVRSQRIIVSAAATTNLMGEHDSLNLCRRG